MFREEKEVPFLLGTYQSSKEELESFFSKYSSRMTDEDTLLVPLLQQLRSIFSALDPGRLDTKFKELGANFNSSQKKLERLSADALDAMRALPPTGKDEKEVKKKSKQSGVHSYSFLSSSEQTDESGSVRFSDNVLALSESLGFIQRLQSLLNELKKKELDLVNWDKRFRRLVSEITKTGHPELKSNLDEFLTKIKGVLKEVNQDLAKLEGEFTALTKKYSNIDPKKIALSQTMIDKFKKSLESINEYINQVKKDLLVQSPGSGLEFS